MIFLWLPKPSADAQTLGKPGLIIHIKEMADKTDNTSSAAPLYRERTPETARPRAPVAKPVTIPNPAPKPAENTAEAGADAKSGKPAELGGPKGLEPTRFGDWERDGRCVDF